MFDKLKPLYTEFAKKPFVLLSFAFSVAVYYQNKQVLKEKDNKYVAVIEAKDKQLKELLQERDEYKAIILGRKRETAIDTLLN